jgi:hypothetical protein
MKEFNTEKVGISEDNRFPEKPDNVEQQGGNGKPGIAEKTAMEQSELTSKKRDPFKIFLTILYVVSLGIYIYFVVDGLQFYRTPYQERPFHEDYRTLRPAGFQGHGFGIVGSAMMLFMLLYSVRKRTRFFGEWGSLSRWLDIHIYFGVMGPLLVILHTSFKVQGLVAVSFWSMIAVASSGILGRYLYLQIPRNQRGDELDLQQIMALDESFNRDLQDTLNLDEDKLFRLEEIVKSHFHKPRSTFSLLIGMMLHDILRPFQVYRLKRLISKELHITEPYLHRVVQLAWRKMSLERRIILLNQIQQLFHYWHVFHKPFAIIMYIIMLVHVGVAIWLGYTWVF